MTEFKPFAATPQSTNLADLVIESDEEKIVIHGDLEIRPDKAGLGHARRLEAMLRDTVRNLETRDLPAESSSSDPTSVQAVNNPFGAEE